MKFLKQAFMYFKKHAIVIAVLTGYLAIALSSIQYDDTTYDEPDHLNYGVHLLKGNSTREVPGADFNSTMPVTALNALPRALEQISNPSMHKNDWGESDIRHGRYVTIIATLVLLIYAFLFGKSVGGNRAGTWALLLFAADPNLMAHSRLVTTDLYGTLGFLAGFYHLYQWKEKKQIRHFYYWCTFMALAQCCKVNNILLYPLHAFILVIFLFRDRQFRIRNFLNGLVIFIAIQLFVINSSFLFFQSGRSLDQINLQSRFFKELQPGFLSDIPLPLPASYIQGFDRVQYERESFEGTAANYLMGELRTGKGFRYYYFLCWALKTPILTQLLVLGAIWHFLRSNHRRNEFLLFAGLPVFVLFLFLNSSSVQSGYRYLLPPLCLLLVFSGATLALWTEKLKSRFLPVIFIGGTLLPLLLTFPNYIAYTNLMIWNKTNAYRFFADSNLDWGQRRQWIKGYLEKNPGILFEPPGPVTGTIVVGINNLTGIVDPEKFAWLRENYKPAGNLQDCYLVYEISKLPSQVIPAPPPR